MNSDAKSTSQAGALPTHDSPPWWRTGVIGAVLDFFTNVKLGIWLMVLLFIYSSIGSAGIVYPEHPNIFKAENWAHDQIRQWPGLEMTEFEWFHWWPFDLMMILLTINIVVTTLRRIPFKAVNYGVWMIHTGIVILVIGSFIYFETKVEGDSPVARRKVVAQYTVEQGDGSVRTETIDFLAAPTKCASRSRRSTQSGNCSPATAPEAAPTA
jgi:cytochrome c biogenesis protein ResB